MSSLHVPGMRYRGSCVPSPILLTACEATNLLNPKRFVRVPLKQPGIYESPGSYLRADLRGGIELLVFLFGLHGEGNLETAGEDTGTQEGNVVSDP